MASRASLLVQRLAIRRRARCHRTQNHRRTQKIGSHKTLGANLTWIFMAFIENRGAKIYWDERGQSDPILLIMGLGYPSDMWHRTRPVLDQRYRTIVLDNRGVGRSEMPAGPYGIDLMASDALAVLDAAGVAKAHVFGISMGGMIAQELALRNPKRVRSLILGCTASGGPSASFWP